MRYLWYGFLGLVSLGLIGLVVGVAGFLFVINYYSKDLPDYSQLKNYQPPIVTRIYAGDGRLMAEFSKEKRVFVDINNIPDLVKNAFIATEDQNFYKHSGVDYIAILRAAVTNFKNMSAGRRPEGASTITQQVAKNFLLSNEVKLERKIREAILARRLEQVLSKDELLELYLNEIYLGAGTYGVAAASLYYFDKSLEELSVAEAAYLGALPKAPNNYHPTRKTKAAVERRDLVVRRMLDEGYITKEEADIAWKTPLEVVKRDEDKLVRAPYFAEEIRRELAQTYDEDGLYKGGLAVRSSLDPHLQDIAGRALREGLVAYDRRHGYRGPFAQIKTMTDWQEQLREIEIPSDIIEEWDLAVVLSVSANEAKLGFANKPQGVLKLENAKWARKYLNEGYAQGPEIKAVTDLFKEGDVIIVQALKPDPAKKDGEAASEKEGDKASDDAATKNESAKEKNGVQAYELQQIPDIQGALIAMDPHTGRVLAMQGGWSYDYGSSEFNRATQAKRQPGSAFKPFIYLAALEKGFTPATLVMDAPFVIEDRPGHFWRPTNYSGEFYGPTPIRVGVEKSKNLMTVRLADFLGMETVAEYAERFGVIKNMPRHLSMSLGAGETTLLDITNGYAMILNGGKRITPTFVDRIQDRNGKTIFKHDKRPCTDCGDRIRWQNQSAPAIPDTREQIADPRTTYQMVSILEGVVQRGTGVRLKSLGYPLGGKTGTTNESKDAWFIGFSPNLVVGVFAGFDNPRSLGKRETGSSIAVPVFKTFMEEALKDSAPVPFRQPPGIRNVKINANTGARARPGDQNTIWEAFLTGTEPTEQVYMLDQHGVNPVNSGVVQNNNQYEGPSAYIDTYESGNYEAPSSGNGAYGADNGGAYGGQYGGEAYQGGGAPVSPSGGYQGGAQNPGGYGAAPAPAPGPGDSANTGTGGLY